MAKPALKEENLPATADQSGVPDFLVEQAKKDQGLGVSTDRSDNIVPQIYVLQPMSPQVDEQSPAHIQGAKPGMVWLRNTPQPLVSADEGILFQPCFFYKDWPEWTPRDAGGGFQGLWPNASATPDDVRKYGADVGPGEEIPDCPDAKFTVNAKTKQKDWKRPNGNDLILTRRHPGYVLVGSMVVPFVLSFKSTGHSVSKNWMFSMMNERTPGGQILPSFAVVYRLKPRQRQNASGKWYQFEVAKERYVTPDEYQRGLALHGAFAAGERTAEVDDAAPAAVGEDQIPF